MKNYSVMPLDTEHIEEICQDIQYQYENNISSCALFCMTLTPEGTPAIDKAALLCEKYDLFRNRLSQMGLECGILVQATIGHGYKLNQPFAFQRYTNVNNGETANVCCPYDEGFRAYIKNAMRTIAAYKPKIIMVDDDFRLMARSGMGCACPLHMKRLREETGEKITREELLFCLNQDDERSKKIKNAYIKTQGEALMGAAKAMRAGIDEINPALPGVYCCCGNAAEFAAETGSILAGAGNSVAVRINNGNYTPAGARGQSRVAFRAAIQKIHMGDKVDEILAETDTCPQNRYSTSAISLHTHFVTSILEGASGAKHWITRMSTYEPESGVHYRRTLAKYSGFYESLSAIVPKLRWMGCNNLMSRVPAYRFEEEKTCYWADCVLERMGIPMFFSSEPSENVFLDGGDAKRFSDAECIEILSGNAVLSESSARIFIERGYKKYLGIDVREWNGVNASYERVGLKGKKVSTQNSVRQIVPEDDSVKIYSTVFHLKDGKEEIPLFPGVVMFKNSLGGNVAVFSGAPKARFKHNEAFSFLCQSRKEQIIKLLSDMDALHMYIEGDDEVYMKGAYMQDGAYFAAITNTGFDIMEEIKLFVDKDVKTVERLNENGKWEKCSFIVNGEFITVSTPAVTLCPVILKIS